MSEERSLGDEIDDALEGVDLQELDLPPVPKAGSGGKGAPPPAAGLTRGTVVGVTGDDVIVELGPRAQGVISAAEFDELPKPGDAFDFAIVGREDELWKLSRHEAKELAALDDLQPGSHVKAKVTGQNTGGLELRLGSLLGFLPASHVGVTRVEDLSVYLGQHLVCEVLEIDRGRKRVLLSRRNVLRAELDAARKEKVGALAPGSVVRGKVTRVEPYGAFVDIGGGVEGLVHVSNISRQRVEDASQVLEPGQEVEAKVLEIKEGGKRIGLGMKQLLPDPWDDDELLPRPDQVLEAKVTKVMEFGVFMELRPGLEGLLHVSQLGDGGRTGRRRDLPAPGASLSVRVVSVDRASRRIALSRLDPRGALLGSEEAADAAEIDDVLRSGEGRSLGTNLGNLFKRAMGER